MDWLQSHISWEMRLEILETHDTVQSIRSANTKAEQGWGNGQVPYVTCGHPEAKFGVIRPEVRP